MSNIFIPRRLPPDSVAPAVVTITDAKGRECGWLMPSYGAARRAAQKANRMSWVGAYCPPNTRLDQIMDAAITAPEQI